MNSISDKILQMKPKLYAFPISHFSEKARFALDRAGYSYDLQLLYPGEHIQILKDKVPETSVPVLETEKGWIQGSSLVLDLVEEKAFGKKAEANERAEEEKIDEILGKGLQTILYYYVLPSPEIVGKLFSLQKPKPEEVIPPPERFDLVSLVLRKKYKINPKNVESVLTRVNEYAQEIQTVYKKRKFYNGISFGRVDLTISSLLGALALPEKAPATDWFLSAEMPKGFLEWKRSLDIDFLLDRIREFYHEFRTHST
ncbi:glutathione S-transferase, N-terminal domain protein [Leptospira ryugenii]|uniref:Glutathione S-transferase, N-terminal domain protein n=1 Tax=Leptospira ryugenii TaxID=1917863 RepID=A0A2P2DZF4_9LEPT|nr:glutathione S-transferase N-terminal domain-containing protein [Leptospira ryugenii]GBF50011.1 glutathione S-transferase, N-terminal domain protein [Leptospira ryugenii]